MKLVEKLARICSDELWGNSMREDPPADLAEKAYTAGFRAAREMAVAKAAQVYTDRTRVKFCRDVSYAIAQLGEDEAPDGA